MAFFINFGSTDLNQLYMFFPIFMTDNTDVK